MNEAYERFMEGQALLTSGNPHDAVVALERARDLEPEQGSIRETLARAYFRTRRFAEAEAEFTKVVELDPVNDYAHFGIGLCAMRAGRSRSRPRAPEARHGHAPGLRGLPRRIGARHRVTVVVLDLDGVLWRGDEPIPGSSDAVQALRDGGARVAFLTNNSSSGSATTSRSSPRFGIAAEPDEVLTSAQAAAELLARDARTRVAACSRAPVPAWSRRSSWRGSGSSTTGPADAVVVGWHRDFDFDGLDRAVGRGA